MKKRLLTIFCISNLLFNAFAQNLDWAYSIQNPVVLESFTDISSNEINRFAVIGTGNMGVSMDVIGSNTSFKSNGTFLAVYNENSQIQWIKDVSGYGFAVKMNVLGEVYLLGTNTKGYLQKYSSSGGLLWTTNFESIGNPNKIQVLADGRIVVAGRSDMDGSVTLSNNSVVNLEKGAFLLEFASNGNLIGAYSISVPDAAAYIYTFDLVSDASNNIFLCGQLDGVADFDIGSGVSQNVLTNAYDAYVVKYSSSFDLLWFKTFGDKNNPKGWDKARAMKIDNNGNLYVGGEFTWTTDFDSSNPGTFVMRSDDNTQVPSGFVMQYSTAGVLNWVNKIGNNNAIGNTDYADARVKDIEITDNNLYVLIEGYGVVDMDPSNSNVYHSAGVASSPSLFFGKYDKSLNYISSFALGTNEIMAITNSVGISMLGSDAFVSSGAFQKKVDFDPTNGTKILEVGPGPFSSFDNDLYLAKYSFSVLNLSDNLSFDEVKIYPNPFKNQINIPVGIKQVFVFDMTGKKVFEQKDPDQILNLNQLNTGTYLINTINANRMSNKKLMVKM